MFSYTAVQRDALKLLSSPAHHIMLFGGSRSGKSFLLCCSLVVRALRSPGSRHAVIRRYCASARNSVGMDTLPKVLQARFRNRLKYRFNRTENFFRFANSSEIWLIGLDDGERAEKILGKEFATVYFNECSELDYAGVQLALTRLAQNSPPLINRAYYDCNPPGKSHWSYALFMEKLDPLSRTPLADPADYAAMQINPESNRKNLPADYLDKTLANLPERERKRFLSGQWQDDVAGALWNPEMIGRCRINAGDVPPLERTVVAVDPAVTSGGSGDLTGIIAAGVDAAGKYYLLADRSMRSTPLEWVRESVRLCRDLKGDMILAEVNNGGELIGTLFAGEAPEIPFKAVRAFKNKYARAEPAAAFYEKGIVFHAGYFPELEQEMCSFKPDTVSSPDRMDALVWALTGLAEKIGDERFILA